MVWCGQTEIKNLLEAVRKKSSFELEYDDHKKRLNERERKLIEREKNLEQKSKRASQSRRQNNPASNSPSKNNKSKNRSIRDQNKASSSAQSADPLHHIRNILPFHWLSLLLLVLLMISIAQKR